MNKIISAFIAFLLILSATASPAFAKETPEISRELDKMVQNIIDKGKSKGAVLSVVKDGKIELCKGYGFADEYLGYTADGERTAFRIGSVSKTFVAVAAQILSQKEQLNINSDISIYLGSDFPKLSYPVTMHQLLTHTAGFEDMLTGIAVNNVSDTEELSESVRKYMPAQVYKPGEVVSYSNYGIALAAYVIECISNQDFAEFCDEEIFKPLDMNRTTFKYIHDIVYVSKPYLPNGNETLEPYMNLYPEGSAVSTAEDMAKYMLWLLNINDTRVLSHKSKKELFQKQFTMSEEFEGMGYIWNRKSRNDEVYYEKKGETLNFYTRIVLYPQKGSGIFLSFNTFVPEHEINAVIHKATDMLYGEKLEYKLESGKSSIIINGLYTNNWSNFTTPEKILRYIIPGKMFYINGSDDNGYYVNGDKMTLVGEDLFSTKDGVVKFQEEGNSIIMSSESAITYVKVPIWQHMIIQILIPLIFFSATTVIFLRELFLMLNKNINKFNRLFLIISATQILLFSVLFSIMYKGVISFSLLILAVPMKIFGWMILSTIAYTIIYAINMKVSGNLLHKIWNASGFLFCLWLFYFNII
jgi:CubicO group peptidase (beta-lactamase class C family)